MPQRICQVGGGFEEGDIPMTTTAIHLDQITRDFGSVRALDQLSPQVPAGMIYGIFPIIRGNCLNYRVALHSGLTTGSRDESPHFSGS